MDPVMKDLNRYLDDIDQAESEAEHQVPELETLENTPAAQDETFCTDVEVA